jgi:phosphoesterase RecJ-like protein
VISKEVATCIYTGIIHDTGVFKYSCTSANTMTIAGKMMEKGIDYSSIIDNSFYAKTYIQNQILGRALLESVLFYDGKCIFSSVSKEIMDFYGVDGKSLGGIVEQLRLTDGVEVAIFIYEIDDGEYKVSLRSKSVIDVSKISTTFGGGGHIRAAGFSAKGSVHSIVNKIGALIEEQYNEIS